MQLAFDFVAREPGERPVVRPTIRGKTRLEAALRENLGPKVVVALTDNRSTMISFKERRGVLYVRIHAVFAEAERTILDAVSSFIRGRPSKRQCALIDDWIEANRHRIKRQREEDQIVLPQGEIHDLQVIFDNLNERYFDDGIQARITWTRAQTGQRRSSIRMGSYCDEQALIRIHPALDQAFVPRYFVASVVFHEMLHQVHGVEVTAGGGRRIHTEAFLADEKQFADYEKARKWELRNLGKLLRY